MEISTDRDRIDRELVHRFLSEESYWARSRTREENDRIIDASLCFGAYDGDRRSATPAWSRTRRPSPTWATYSSCARPAGRAWVKR